MDGASLWHAPGLPKGEAHLLQPAQITASPNNAIIAPARSISSSSFASLYNVI